MSEASDCRLHFAIRIGSLQLEDRKGTMTVFTCAKAQGTSAQLAVNKRKKEKGEREEMRMKKERIKKGNRSDRHPAVRGLTFGPVVSDVSANLASECVYQNKQPTSPVTGPVRHNVPVLISLSRSFSCILAMQHASLIARCI